MHIVIFGDQHVETLGGAQVSTRLQRAHLERAGHSVTVVAPRRRSRDPVNADDPAYLDLPSIPVTWDREYSFTWPGGATDAFIDRALSRRVARGAPMPDLVHVQADFWGAFLGHRLARRLRVPVVQTMHNRVDVGIEATTPFPALVLRALNAWRRRALPGSGPGDDGWAYLRGLARGASAVTAPSGHFARRLERHGVFGSVDVVWNGIDDDVRDRVLAAAPSARAEGRPRLVWVGRMSPEKRLLPLLEAFAASAADAELEVIGGGFEHERARRLAADRGIADRVAFAGRLSYEQTLGRIAAADALVQTSIGFETQGMTPFEAATLGTPSIISDPDVAGELDGGIWEVDAPEDEPSRVAALAASLRRAAADIASGSAPVPSERVAAEFRQSSRTAAMIEIYERVLTR
ncbi:glycosyltransferase [Microbacterium betulae]|uniref:D-inositol 3-phosphate glycosyltransferase n=1 Tax=Microbacterium betulae TaxID=2981139 RepID=A0AA97FJ92_9MICO|nr:glycosyltransferase [Microbacterium sp. AB]WOF23049.1 glycosyltransferase [Microbacterium sp. AB]